MNHEEEINYRNKILFRVRNGDKISAEDRVWLATHRLYNRLMGYPYLNTDIIQLLPKVNYRVKIKVETLSYQKRILPVIAIPGGKGGIYTNFALVDYNGNISKGKPVKMLGVLIDSEHDESEIAVCSHLGLLSVSFECEYFDEKQHLTIRKCSNVGDPNFAMIRETISENKIRYRCKIPGNITFDSYVFTIEWNAK